MMMELNEPALGLLVTIFKLNIKKKIIWGKKPAANN